MSRQKLNITEIISELQQIIQKYGGIPSAQVDRAAYAKIHYVIKHYANDEEVRAFIAKYSDMLSPDRRIPKSGNRRIDLKLKVEEFKQIIAQYGRIPSQYEDKPAYAKISYCIRHYSDTPEMQEFLAEYGNQLSIGTRTDFKTRLEQLTEALHAEERIPAVKENQELYVAVRYFFSKYADRPEVVRLKYLYAHSSCYPLVNTIYGPKPESKKILTLTYSGNQYFSEDNPELPIWQRNVAYEFIEHVYKTYNQLPAKKCKPMQSLLKDIERWERYNKDCSTDIAEGLHAFLKKLINLGCREKVIVYAYNSIGFGKKEVQDNVRNLLIENGACAIHYIAQCANPGKPVSDTFAYYYYYVLMNDSPKCREQLVGLGELYRNQSPDAVLRVHYRDYTLCNVEKISQRTSSCMRDWEQSPPQSIEEWRQYGCCMFFSAEARSSWIENDSTCRKTFVQACFDNGHPYFRYYRNDSYHRYLDYLLFLMEHGYRLKDKEMEDEFDPLKLCNHHELSQCDYETVYKVLCLREDCIVDQYGTVYIDNGLVSTLLMIAPGTVSYSVKPKTDEIAKYATALCRRTLKYIRFGEGVSLVKVSFSSCDALEKIIIPQKCCAEYRTAFTKKDATFFYNYEGAKIPVQAVYDGTTLVSVPYVEHFDVPEGTTEIAKNAFRDTHVKRVTIAGSVKHVAGSLFWCQRQLEQVVFREGVETIGDSVFGYCEKLQSITFPYSLKEIGGGQIFDNCKELKSIHLKECVTTLGYRIFDSCSIEYLRIDGYIRRLSSWSAYYSPPLRRIVFNGGIGWIECTFNGCRYLEEITFKGEYERFEKENMGMFEKCDRLKSIIIRRKYYDFFIDQISESKRHLVTVVD